MVRLIDLVEQGNIADQGIPHVGLFYKFQVEYHEKLQSDLDKLCGFGENADKDTSI